MRRREEVGRSPVLGHGDQRRGGGKPARHIGV